MFANIENLGHAKNVEFVDLVKSFPTSIWLQKVGFATAEKEPLKVWITDLADHTLDYIPTLL